MTPIITSLTNQAGLVFKLGDQVTLHPDMEESSFGNCGCGYPRVGIVVGFNTDFVGPYKGVKAILCKFEGFTGQWQGDIDEMVLRNGDVPENKWVYWAEIEKKVYKRGSAKRTWDTEWEINRGLYLPRLAADFYTLLDLEIDFPKDKEVKEKLEKLTNLLANQFANYLNMAIGGEVRHCKYRVDQVPRKFLGDPLVIKTFLHLPHSTMHLREREVEWACWKKLQVKEGVLPSLRAAYKIFKQLRWQAGYGGSKWATITKTLLMHLEGKTSKIIFIDTTFGLKHNGSVVFDKVWASKLSLITVLDINQKGLVHRLLAYTTEDVTSIYKKLRGPLK